MRDTLEKSGEPYHLPFAVSLLNSSVSDICPNLCTDCSIEPPHGFNG